MATTVLGLTNDYADGAALEAEDVSALADGLESVFASYLSLDLAGSGDYTLDPATEARAEIIELTGTLTGARNLIVPTSWAGREWLIYNNTSGAFTLTVKTAAGAGIVIGFGKNAAVWTNGTRVLRLTADTTPTA